MIYNAFRKLLAKYCQAPPQEDSSLIYDISSLQYEKSHKKISEVSKQVETQSILQLREDLPPGWMAITNTDIGDCKLEIVGLNFSANHESPDASMVDASQHGQPDVEMIQSDSRIDSGNIDPTKSDIFHCQANCLELKLDVSFGSSIHYASFSPTSQNLLISGCDSLRDHSLRIWRQRADGNWSENGRVKDSQEISHQLNSSENALLSSSHDGNVKVSTLNSVGCWEEALVLPPLKEGYPPVVASFSPLQDKIMSYDHMTGKINVFSESSDGKWFRLRPQEGEISCSLRAGVMQTPFKATDNYLLTHEHREATIWYCGGQFYPFKKFTMHRHTDIQGVLLSDDERHAMIFSQANQVDFLGCDVDGNWSSIGTVRHSEQEVNHDSTSVPNSICTASFNASGQYALTKDNAQNVIISGYDNNGAWVGKIAISGCDHAAFSPSGGKLLANLGSGFFKLWDCNRIGSSLDESQAIEHIDSDNAIFSPSENLLLSHGNKTDYVCIWGNDKEGNLVEQAKVCHPGGISSAAFNAQEDSVLTCGSNDCTVKIQGLDSQGLWQEWLVVKHQDKIDEAQFSSSGRLAFTVSEDTTACILGCDDNGKWTKQAVTSPDGYSIMGAHFNGVDNHFLTYGNKINGEDNSKPGLVQLWGIVNDGKWAKIELITLDHSVMMAKFSPDSDHLMIHCKNNHASEGSTALLWKIPGSPRQS